MSVATRRPSRRTATIASMVAIPAAVAVSGLVVAQASYSAYSATTVTPTNNWATGTVVLANDANTAAFSATNLKPGSTGTKCIVVTSSGSLASAVKLYGTNPSSTKGLASAISLNVTQGTGGSFGSCTGFTALPSGSALYSGTLENFGTTHTNFSNGLGSWAPTGTATESRTYQITYTVSGSASDATQGGTAAIGLTWEAQNT